MGQNGDSMRCMKRAGFTGATWVVLLFGAISVHLPKVSGANAGGIIYSTYLGGTRGEDAGGIAVDHLGNVYVTGTTESPDFPTTAVGTNRTVQGNTDAFVTKFSSDGDVLYSTLVGGPCEEVAQGIAVDDAGNAYITGTLRNCASLDAPTGVLVAKLDPTGHLIYLYTFGSGLLNVAVGTAITIDTAGNAYITGYAKTSFNLPTTPHAFQPTSCGGIPEHGFVAKVNPARDGLVYLTYLCGSGEDSPTAIAVDSSGNAYVAGATTSPDFPIRDAYQSTRPGGDNAESAFLTKLNPDGTGLIFSTYLGGSYETIISGLALGPHGAVYATGATAGGDFPTTPGVVQAIGPDPGCAYGGICADAFVTKFSPQGTLIYSTVLGGAGQDEGQAIAVNQAGEAVVLGYTSSTTLPLRHAFQVEPHGPDDAFVFKLNADATRILFSSYLGGGRPTNSTAQTEGGEEPAGIALGPGGDVWVMGSTTSFDFPTTPNAFQPKSVGVSCILWGEPCGDIFVTRLNVDEPAAKPAEFLEISPVTLSPGQQLSAHWEGIHDPSPHDQLLLFPLGATADGRLFVPSYPTTGEAEGTLTFPVPNDLEPGTYELRLMTPQPDFPALLEPSARSEPLTITAGPMRLLPPAVIGTSTFRFQIADAQPGNYTVQAADSLSPPIWRPIGGVVVSAGPLAQFSIQIDSTNQVRFFRMTK